MKALKDKNGPSRMREASLDLSDQQRQYRDRARRAMRDQQLQRAREYWSVVRTLSGGHEEASHSIADIDCLLERDEEALRELVLCIQAHPKDEVASLMAARIYRKKSCLREAQWHYQRVLDLIPMHPEGLEEYADLLLESDQVHDALSLLERLRSLHREEPVVLMKMADAFSRVGDSRKAIDRLKQAYRMDPTHLELRLRLAEVYLRESMHQQAVSLLMPLDEDGDIPARKLSILADCKTGLKKYDEAEELIARFESLYPADPQGARCRARLYRELSLAEDEEAALLRVLELEKSWDNVQALIDFWNEHENYEQLESFLSQQLSDFPDEPRLFEQLAILYREDAPAEALDWVEKSLQSSVQRETAILKGELLIRLNRYAQATQWFESMKQDWPDEDLDVKVERLIEQDRSFKETLGLSRRAEEALESNSWKKALYYYKEMVTRVPDNPEWLEQLGNLYSFETSYMDAMDCFERASEFVRVVEKDRLSEKMFTLAYLHNDFEKALSSLEETSEQERQRPLRKLQVLKVQRHLLAGKLRSPEYFEKQLSEVSQNLKDALPLRRLVCGYAHLYLGSHLLDSGVWAGTATEVFTDLNQDPAAEALHQYALEGLYMVFLMDGQYDRLLPLLEDWMKREPSEKVLKLYLQELGEKGQYREAVRTLERWLQELPEDLQLRALKMEMAWLEMEEAGRSRHARYLLARLKENCQRQGEWYHYYDLALGLRVTTRNRVSEEAFQSQQQAIKKAVKAGGERPDLSVAMLRVLEYGDRLSGADTRMGFNRRRLFLEKELTRFADSPALLMEYGHLLLDEDPNTAEKLLLKALTLDPELSLANRLLGDYHFRNKDLKKAWHCWLKSMETPLSRAEWNSILQKMQRML